MFRMVFIGLVSLTIIGCSSGMKPYPITDVAEHKFQERVQYDTDVDDRLIVSSADLENQDRSKRHSA